MKRRIMIALMLLLSACRTPASELQASDAGSGQWTGLTSEEKGEDTPAICPDGVVSGISCEGKHCDNISLQCTGGFADSGGTWTSYFSEEQNNESICPDRSYVTGIRCQGRYCDNVSLRCTPRPELTATSCYWTLPIPDYKANYEFPKGTRLTGLRCSGDYCGSPSARLCQTEPSEICKDEACFENLAKTYAPLLRFDQKQGELNKCFPGPADEYFAARKSGSKERICNTDLESVRQGQIPIYYQYQGCGTNEVTILYWFFYGWQDTCSPNLGSHPADWERIAVKIKNGQLQKVMFYQHAGSYTRTPGNFEVFEKTHPIVYVGKNSHGSYHDDGGTGSCLYFEDFRNPGSSDKKMETWRNLVLLSDDRSSPEWMSYREGTFWDGLTGPLARNINLCGLRSCAGKDFNLGDTLCFGQCGCNKSIGGDAPF